MMIVLCLHAVNDENEIFGFHGYGAPTINKRVNNHLKNGYFIKSGKEIN